MLIDKQKIIEICKIIQFCLQNHIFCLQKKKEFGPVLKKILQYHIEDFFIREIFI